MDLKSTLETVIHENLEIIESKKLEISIKINKIREELAVYTSEVSFLEELEDTFGEIIRIIHQKEQKLKKLIE